MFCLFNKKSIGIDIADHRIWVTRLAKSGGNFVIDNLKGTKLKTGIVENGRIKNKKELAKIINSLMGELQAESSCEKKIVFGLPKNQSYVHVFSDSSGNTDKKYIERIVKKDTEESIPLEADDLYYNYKILEKDHEQTNILVMAVSKNLIYEWQELFASLKIDVQVYDLNSLATFRNLYNKAPKKPICMIDIGGDFTSIAIFNNKGLRYSHAIKTAGEAFTEGIASSLKVSSEEAEKIKQKQGMKNKDIFNALVPELQPIIDASQDIFNYLKEKTGEDIEKIVLVGGSALMKGLPEYFESKFEKPVELGKPIINGSRNTFEHINSIGLALRGFEKRSKQKDPGLLPIEKNKDKIKKKEELSPIKEAGENSLKNFSDEGIGQAKEDRKIEKQKIILLIILLVGAILIGTAFWYRNLESNKKQVVGEVDKKLFPYENTTILQIPIAISKTEFTRDRVEGRIVESMDANLKNGEILWPEPVLLNPNRWLVYSMDGVQSFIFANIKEKLGNNFSLGNIDYESIAYTDNRNLLLLRTKVMIYSAIDMQTEEEPIVPEQITEDNLTNPSTASSSIEKIEIEKKLKIKDTPTGWLNVRGGAGLNYAIVKKVDSGSEFVYLNENNGWYEIVLDDNNSGWVSGEYINLLN